MNIRLKRDAGSTVRVNGLYVYDIEVNWVARAKPRVISVSLRRDWHLRERNSPCPKRFLCLSLPVMHDERRTLLFF